LDALSSAAYGPEAALTPLIPLGAAGIAYMVPISASIIVLLTIVYFSYRHLVYSQGILVLAALAALLLILFGGITDCLTPA
jgi:hypothetical protein